MDQMRPQSGTTPATWHGPPMVTDVSASGITCTTVHVARTWLALKDDKAPRREASCIQLILLELHHRTHPFLGCLLSFRPSSFSSSHPSLSTPVKSIAASRTGASRVVAFDKRELVGGYCRQCRNCAQRTDCLVARTQLPHLAGDVSLQLRREPLPRNRS
jgi:hypothetical protein